MAEWHLLLAPVKASPIFSSCRDWTELRCDRGCVRKPQPGIPTPTSAPCEAETSKVGRSRLSAAAQSSERARGCARSGQGSERLAGRQCDNNHHYRFSCWSPRKGPSPAAIRMVHRPSERARGDKTNEVEEDGCSDPPSALEILFSTVPFDLECACGSGWCVWSGSSLCHPHLCSLLLLARRR